ncbi:hypothetical protein GC176_04560 [bacterium]|nr:hypothetical protein [bacterium]
MSENAETQRAVSPWRSFVLVAAVAAILVSGAASDAVTQRRTPQNRLAVDVMRLRSGEKLLGAVLNESSEGTLRVAVQRDWLRKSLPDYYRSVVSDETAAQQKIATELIERIDRWVAEVKSRPPEQTDTKQLLAFLDDQQSQLEQRLKQLQDGATKLDATTIDGGLETQFVLLELPRGQVSSHFIQAAEQRRIALLAWRERFREVETLTADQLRAALESRKIDVADNTEPVDLSDRVPPAAQTDDEWAARQAIVEFQLVRPLEFQGTGGALFRTDGDAAQVDLAAMLPQLLQSQLTSQLADLLEEPGLGNAGRARKTAKATASTESLGQAIREAEQLGLRGFRVTQLDLDLPRGQARVTEQFVARMPGKQWKIVWSETVAEDARQARAAAEEQIGNDPQVKQLLQIAKQLGGAGDQVKTAVRFGAATMAAQQSAAARFFTFRDRHTQRLDGPPLRVK